jgi:hypothetical protein
MRTKSPEPAYFQRFSGSLEKLQEVKYAGISTNMRRVRHFWRKVPEMGRAVGTRWVVDLWVRRGLATDLRAPGRCASPLGQRSRSEPAVGGAAPATPSASVAELRLLGDQALVDPRVARNAWYAAGLPGTAVPAYDPSLKLWVPGVRLESVSQFADRGRHLPPLRAPSAL